MSNNAISSAPNIRPAFEELKALAASTGSMLYYPCHGESGDTEIACALGVGPTIALDSDGTDEWTANTNYFTGRDDGSHHGKVAIPSALESTLFNFEGNLFALSAQVLGDGDVTPAAVQMFQMGAFAADGGARYSGLQLRYLPGEVPGVYWNKSDGTTELNRLAQIGKPLGSGGNHTVGNFLFLFDYRDGGDGTVICHQSWERATGAPTWNVATGSTTSVTAGEAPVIRDHDLEPLIHIGAKYREDNTSWTQAMVTATAIRRIGFTNFGVVQPGNLTQAIQEMLYNNMVPGHQWYKALKEARG